MILDIDLRAFGGSALTDDIDVPKDRAEDGSDPGHLRAGPQHGLPRRSRLALAEVRGASDIFIGVNALDYSGYPDCRPEYIEAFEAMANLATKAGVEGSRLQIHAPLMQLTKAADHPPRASSWASTTRRTHSCYDPDADGRPVDTATAACCACEGSRPPGATTPRRIPAGALAPA